MIIIKDISTQLLYEINPPRESGEVTMLCPKCSSTRKKSRVKCFSWNADKRAGHCHHCSADFVENRPLKEHQAKVYRVPEWKNKTELTEKSVKWFEGRMISQATLVGMKIYSDTIRMPQFDKPVEVICFPYFVGGELKNIKSRGPQKSFKIESGAELVFYNFDCIANSAELIIVEGEIDALSFIDAGFSNVVSVPNGASGTDLPYLDNYIERLEKITKFYIATDFDEPGIKLRNELVRRLGSEKCVVVTFEGHKDANELFKNKGGIALRRVLENAEEIPVEGMIGLESRYDDIQLLFKNGLPEGYRIGDDSIDDYIRWQTSRLAIWTGIPSHGKSEMVDYVNIKLALSYGWKTLFFSPENFPLEFHYAKLASKITGKGFKEGKMTVAEFEESYEFILSNFFWMDPYTNATLEDILKRTELYVKRHGVKQLVIDPYNCLEHSLNKGETESIYIGRFLDTLARFSKKHDILIHLVAHPTKMQKDHNSKAYPPPSLYDISGSANFYNKADYGLTVHRDFAKSTTNLHVTKVKFRNLGKTNLDGITLHYNTNNGRYEQFKAAAEYEGTSWLNKDSFYINRPLHSDDDETPF